MSSLVSIIVPVYNVEKYLARCIDSLINQTYKNLEIILVNDGSPDNSGTICDEYAAKDNRVQVVHKNNGGLSSARNAGLDICTGEYVCFIDSDDFISAYFVEYMLEKMVTYNCEIVKCSFVKGTKNAFVGEDVENDECLVISGNEATYSRHYSVIACDKMYKSSLFKNVRFPLVKKNEDEAIYYQLAYAVKSVCITKRVLYYYFMSDNSIMRNDKEQDFTFMEIFRDRIQFFKQLNESELCSKSYCKYLLSLLYVYSYSKFRKINADNCKMLHSEIKIVISHILKSKHSGLFFKTIALIFKFAPSVSAYLIFKILESK